MMFALKSAYNTIVMRFIRFLIVRLYKLSLEIVDSTRDFALFWRFLIKTADKRERSLIFAVGNHNFTFSSHYVSAKPSPSHSKRMLRAGWMEEMM